MKIFIVTMKNYEPFALLYLLLLIKTIKIFFSGINIDGKSPSLNILYYGIIADCPALSLITKFLNHGGYFCCFYCYTKGYHNQQCKKRQYPLNLPLNVRGPESFEIHAKRAEDTGEVVYAHIGRSELTDILDVPFPISILCDYLNVTLLRHFQDVVKALSCSLVPGTRKDIDQKLRTQVFPHFFHRQMRGIEDLSFIKATELRNLLLYVFLPRFYGVLPIDQVAHISLFICGIRLLHGSREKFGDSTSFLAEKLLKLYYLHHPHYYDYLENFVLHLHIHYSENYQRHGALASNNTFAQEDLIGYIASNRNGEL
ncbi:unnamed protein product [Rotaria sp. Silwood2]|nr:unnamed protein product [Rotaria sp. Silwood2]CAF4450854.1 unnamed protein product [Rotaria sp. Silwood2]